MKYRSKDGEIVWFSVNLLWEIILIWKKLCIDFEADKCYPFVIRKRKQIESGGNNGTKSL